MTEDKTIHCVVAKGGLALLQLLAPKGSPDDDMCIQRYMIWLRGRRREKPHENQVIFSCLGVRLRPCKGFLLHSRDPAVLHT